MSPAFLNPSFHPTTTLPPTCTAASPLPPDYPTLLSQSQHSTRAAIKSGQKLLELQFPPIPNMATAALNQLLDANRAFADRFIRPFQPTHPLHLVFPDSAEARLAARAFGDTPYAIHAIPKKSPLYIRDPDALVVVVQPGFNVAEWIDLPNLVGEATVVVVNGDFDKVRGGYYPRLFYPALYKVGERVLKRFEPVYYIRQFSNGGSLMKRFGEPWQLFYRNVAGDPNVVVWSGEKRPEFTEVERILREERLADQMRGV